MAENDNKPMDNAIDALIRSASSDIVTEMFDKIDASINDEDIHFSENHIRAMNKILYSQTVADDNRIKHFRLNKRLILVAIITMTIVLIAALSVGADRLKFLDYFMNVSDISTDFTKSPESEKGVYYVDENIRESSVKASESKYSIKRNYIPDGFILTDSSESRSISTYRYSCNDKYFDVDKSIVPDTLSIDTENADTQYIDINGCKAFISIKPNIVILTWTNNNILYTVNGNIDKETLIKIAENME